MRTCGAHDSKRGSAIGAVLVVLFGGLGCERPWAKVPPSIVGIPACAGISGPLTPCEWFAGFDDVLIFHIDGREARFEPLQRNNGEAVEDAESCRVIDPALLLLGSTASSAHGSVNTAVVIPGDHEPIDDDALLAGTRVLVPIVRVDGEALRGSVWPVVDEDDRIVFAGRDGCASGSEVVGLTANELLAAIATCPARAPDPDRLSTGAVCFVDE